MPTAIDDRSYVFISYASVDRDRVLPIIDRLEAAGLGVWFDREGIHGGANYALEIAEAIEGSTALILMCSDSSLASRNVKQELALGWRFEKPYLPLLLDQVEIPKDVAYWLEGSQWIELLDRPEPEWLADLATALEPLKMSLTLQAGLPTAASRNRPVLVGREREQTLLRRHLDRMLAGQGSVVLIGGEAGIGKTTLVEDLSFQAEEGGCLVLCGHAYDLSVTPPYGPWADLMAHFQPPTDSPIAPALGQPGTPIVAESQDALLQEVSEFLRATSSLQPLVVVLEDMHWSDSASLELLRFVARSVITQRLLLVVTYRDDEPESNILDSFLPLLVREARAVRVSARPLDTESVHSLVGARYQLPADDLDRLTDYLQTHGEGNPFFIGELLRSLEEEEVIEATSGRATRVEFDRVQLPEMLRRVIGRRISRLSPETLEMMQAGAVIGAEVPLDLWTSVTERDDEQLAKAMEEARAARLLLELPGGDRWVFVHALYRETLYRGLVSPRRRQWHRRVALALETSRTPDPDTVAYHLLQADDERAVDWLIKAGERAENARVLRIAAERFMTAEELLRDSHDRAGERAWILYRVARNLRFAEPEQSIRYLERSVAAAVEVGDTTLQARAGWELGLQHCNTCHYRRGIEEMLAADSVLQGDHSSDLTEQRQQAIAGIDRKRGTLVLMFAHAGRYAEALEFGNRYLSLIDSVMSFDDLIAEARSGWTAWADACFGLGLARAALGQPAEATELLQRARQGYVADRHEPLESLVLAHLLQEVHLPYAADQPEERHQLTMETQLATARADNLAIGPDALVQSGVLCVHLLEGDWASTKDAALAEIESPTMFQEPAHLNLAELRRRQGDATGSWNEVRFYLPDQEATVPGDSPYFFAAGLQQTAIALSLEAGDLDGARAWLDAHDRWLDWSGAVRGRAERDLLWAQYHHVGGDAGRAREMADQALAAATAPRQPQVIIAAERLLGQLDAESGDLVEAEDHLRQSDELAEQCRAPFNRALTLLELARLQMAQERLDEAQAICGQVRSICNPLGAKPTLKQVAALEQRIANTKQAGK